jgi:hypothetical protein
MGCLAAVTEGCTDQRNLYVLSGPVLQVKGDWIPSIDKSDMTMGATALAFDSEGKATKHYFDAPNTVDIPVTKGSYEVMLFNGLMYSPTDTHLDGVTFRGTDRLDTFEAVAAEGVSVRRLGSRTEGEYVATNDMEVVTSAVESADIDRDHSYYAKYKNGHNGYDTPDNFIYQTLDMTPVAMSYEAQVVVTIKNITSAAGASAALYGFVGSAFMASRQPSHFYVTHQFNLNSRKMIDAAQDTGTIESPVFVTFGPPLDVPDQKYEIYIKMVLINNQEIERTFDVTDQVTPIVEDIKANLAVGASIEYRLEIPLEIELELPVVEHVEGSIGIEGWEDEELIHVPITS